jgi:hypothetical protein
VLLADAFIACTFCSTCHQSHETYHGCRLTRSKWHDASRQSHNCGVNTSSGQPENTLSVAASLRGAFPGRCRYSTKHIMPLLGRRSGDTRDGTSPNNEMISLGAPPRFDRRCLITPCKSCFLVPGWSVAMDNPHDGQRKEIAIICHLCY